MSDTYTMKTISEESIGMGTVTTTYQVGVTNLVGTRS